ncbi:MAG: hypothetical protein R2706_20215 [Acidimicrobiales bacterium]
MSLDTDDDITEVGVPGELRFAGPTVFAGYLDSTGEEFDSQGFYRTGDVQWAAMTNRPPFFSSSTERRDIIIRGGMNVSAAEVEALVSNHERHRMRRRCVRRRRSGRKGRHLRRARSRTGPRPRHHQ